MLTVSVVALDVTFLLAVGAVLVLVLLCQLPSLIFLFLSTHLYLCP